MKRVSSCTVRRSPSGPNPTESGRGIGRRAGRPWRALCVAFGSGLVALTAGCASSRPVPRPPPADADLLRLSAAANRVFVHAGPERAAPLYREALLRARALDADSAIRPLAFNLAACLFDAGDLAEAELLLQEALASAARSREPEAEIRVLQARIAARQGDGEVVRRAVEVAHRAASAERRRDLVQAVTLLEAEWALDAGEFEQAESALRLVERGMKERAPDALHAQVDAVRARLFESQARWAEAAAAWDKRARRLGTAGLARAVPPALQRAGKAWEAAGRSEEAAERWYRAARAWLAQARAEEGQVALDHAWMLTESDALRAALDALRREMEMD